MVLSSARRGRTRTCLVYLPPAIAWIACIVRLLRRRERVALRRLMRNAISLRSMDESLSKGRRLVSAANSYYEWACCEVTAGPIVLQLVSKPGAPFFGEA